jgi:LmbE family N-acetylglucosaminyl deacetylase
MSPEPRRLMAVLAHPDDETLGFGGTLVKYAREGVEVSVVTASRGERGRYGDGSEPHPGPEALGRIREAELRAAAATLGVREVSFLDYLDAEIDRANPIEIVTRIVSHIRRFCPQVVITFDLWGAYGHPDHIAICQFATAAMTAAADPGFAPGAEAHRVSKLYYMATSPARWAAYQEAFKKLVSKVDGVEREAVPSPEWSITTWIDTAEFWPVVWKAVQCHATQIGQYKKLGELSTEHQHALWGTQTYYRVASLVNGGRTRETCLFEGIE